MKQLKLIKLALFSIVLTSSLFPMVSEAALDPNNYLKPFEYQDQNGKASTPEDSKLAQVQNLPKTDWNLSIATLIKLLLNISGAVALAVLTYGGYLMVSSRGDTKGIDKAKKIITESVIGLMIMGGAYAIVLGVSEFQFFSGGSESVSAPPAAPAPKTP